MVASAVQYCWDPLGECSTTAHGALPRSTASGADQYCNGANR